MGFGMIGLTSKPYALVKHENSCRFSEIVFVHTSKSLGKVIQFDDAFLMGWEKPPTNRMWPPPRMPVANKGLGWDPRT